MTTDALNDRDFLTNVPHLALPFRFVTQPDGTLAADHNEQDTAEEISDCVEAVIRYERGYRPEQPEFGITDPTFQMGLIRTQDVVDDVAEWEPRAEVEINAVVDSVDEFLQYMTVKVGNNASGGANA